MTENIDTKGIQVGLQTGSGFELFRHLSDFEPKETSWLWNLRIPVGEITVVDGDPGSNKSSVLLDLAARVSTGRVMPDGTKGMNGGVLLLLAEDSISKTVRQRLEAAGADLKQIAVLEQHALLPRDNALIEKAATQLRAQMIVIDPVMAFLQPNSCSDQRVRQAITPLAELAERISAAIVLVRHLIKSGRGNPIYRGSGSIGIIGAARSALLIGKSPDDQNLRVVCQTKSNLGPLASSLLFEPIDQDGTPCIEWRGECDYSPEELLKPLKPNTNRLTEAMSFLTTVLGDGPVEQSTIKQSAISKGLAYRTVERAKEVLGIVSIRIGWGPGSRCSWQLPDAETDDDHSTPNRLEGRTMNWDNVFKNHQTK